ncbi:uncharacterized protein BCR38DRAFT_485412 [Pseudomassariella vexata]|uniref:Uncharacterized protein n=1 Tax=Pseudomassariella vexata TaxID=1141098 RepID=A0A1Y2DYV9_9PEZI|nr:uncharacterized protein BCR38DRAFT_485412 [Pseudomassariella vexata]ORY64274.1 hypothetical protein BCR38DRAFT_485412 [Pseudomassariella vexata]
MSNNLDPQFQRLAAYYLRRDFGITKNDTSTLQIQSSSQPPPVQDNRLQTPGLVQPETAKTNTALSPDVRSADLVVTKILTRSIVEDLDSTTVEPFLQPSDQTKRNETADTKRTTAVDEATVDKRTTATDEATVDQRTTAAKRIDMSGQTVLLFGLEVDYTSRRSLSRKKIRKLLKRTRKIPDSQAESRESWGGKRREIPGEERILQSDDKATRGRLWCVRLSLGTETNL